MPKRDKEKDSFALGNFKSKVVMIVEELAKLLRCSPITARRRLKEWRAYTSYNRNGRFYVLPDIPKFDVNGLWRYRTISFSKYGNLKKTVVRLVHDSAAGLPATELGKLVGLLPRSFLSHFRGVEQLHREIVGNRFVYFSSDKKILARQKQKRQEAEARARLAELPMNAESIDILVERIKHPHLSAEQLSVRLRKKGHRIAPEAIRNFFAYHGLLKKKRVHNGQSIKRPY